MHSFALLVSVSAALAAGDAPTFNKDIAPIVFQHCANCHRPGAVAPMSLLTYAEARPWAKAMRQAVHDRAMPPWDADPKIGKFSNDISLKQEEIDTIMAWVDHGAPEGAPADLPAAPQFPDGWQLGEPDYVVDLPECSVPASGPDRFPNILVSLDLPQEASLRAVELRPGDTRVLHHLVLFHGGIAMSEDIIDQRKNKSGTILDPAASPNVMYVYAAGSPPGVFPKGMGHKLKPQDTLSMNAHYHPYGEATTDRSKVGLYFAKEPLQKLLTTVAAINPALQIPPNSTDHTQRAYYQFSQDSRIVSYLPHMHVRGQSIRYIMHYPDGATADLLNVPAYDYNWQWIYYPELPVKVPAGSMLEVIGTWDNSSANTLNPDPSKHVQFGEGTNDEMLVGFAEFVSEEGESPRAESPMVKIASALARHPADDSYLISAMPYSFGLYAPKQGEGVLYVAAGEIMVSPTLSDITWRGDRAIINTRMLTPNAGSMPFGISLNVVGDKFTGGIHFGQILKPEQLDQLTIPGGQPFKGTRIPAKVAAAPR